MILESELYGIFYLAKDFTCFLGGGMFCFVLLQQASRSWILFLSWYLYPRVGWRTTFYIFVRYRVNEWSEIS